MVALRVLIVKKKVNYNFPSLRYRKIPIEALQANVVVCAALLSKALKGVK